MGRSPRPSPLAATTVADGDPAVREAAPRAAHARALPIAAVALGSGIALGERFHPEAAAIAIAAFVLAALLVRVRGEPRCATWILWAAFALLGATRGAAIPRDEERERQLAAWIDRDVVVVGRIATLPDGASDETRFVLVTEAIRDVTGWHPMVARLRAVAPVSPAALRDFRRVLLRGSLRPIRDAGNPGEPRRARALHLAGFAGSLRVRDAAWIVPIPERGVPPGFATRIQRWRARTARLLESSLPAEHAAVLEALLIGLTGGVPGDLQEIFVRTGTAHVLAVSGLNVALVVLAVHGPLRWLCGWSRRVSEEGRGQRLAALGAAGAAIAYVFLAGGEPPVVRSAIASACALAASWLGRPNAALQSLALGFVVIAALAPESLWSVSFRLSFLATAGLVLAGACISRTMAPVAPRRDLVSRIASGAAQTWLATVVATWATFPLTVGVFGRWTALGLVANPLAVPLLATAAVPVGLLGVALAPFSSSLATAAFRVAELPVAAGLGILRGVAGWQGFDGHTPLAPELVALAGSALALASLGARRRRHRRAAALGVLVAALVAVAGPRVLALLRRAPSIVFLAVGHGDAAIVALPGGRTWLVDAGPAREGRAGSGDSAVVRALAALGTQRVDVLVASHLQLDHVGGLGAVLDRYPIGELWLPRSVPVPSWLASELARAARGGTAIVALDAGSAVLRHDGVRVEVLHPPSAHATLTSNDASLVLRVELAGEHALFAGDVERAGEELLVAGGRDARAVVLKVPHHGSITSSSFALLRAVAPRVAIVSAARGSRVHPAPAVAARFAALGIEVWNTGEDGAVTLRFGRDAIEVGAAHRSPSTLGAARARAAAGDCCER
ncbi:MAG: DNA internalization-related competence protein ComEC/Rec2 [bacterium]